jgi:hypothetical protein
VQCYFFPKRPSTLAGFEPRAFVLQPDAMITVPRGQGKTLFLLRLFNIFLQGYWVLFK